MSGGQGVKLLGQGVVGSGQGGVFEVCIDGTSGSGSEEGKEKEKEMIERLGKRNGGRGGTILVLLAHEEGWGGWIHRSSVFRTVS